MQPGDSIWGSEEREDPRNRIKEVTAELKGGDDVRGAEDELLKIERGVENGGTKLVSQEMEQHQVSSETQERRLTTDNCSSDSIKSQTVVSQSDNDLSSVPLTEEQTQQKEKVNEHNCLTQSINQF